jgi:hypothetical protein
VPCCAPIASSTDVVKLLSICSSLKKYLHTIHGDPLGSGPHSAPPYGDVRVSGPAMLWDTTSCRKAAPLSLSLRVVSMQR